MSGLVLFSEWGECLSGIMGGLNTTHQPDPVEDGKFKSLFPPFLSFNCKKTLLAHLRSKVDVDEGSETESD